MRYIPYIKYVVAPETRFERDVAIFFDPKGPVSKGELLENYGWHEWAGFKKLIEAFYLSARGCLGGFEDYYEKNIRWTTENIVEILKKDGLVEDGLKGLIRLDIRQNVAVPVLLVEIKSIKHKFCLKPTPCNRLWLRDRIPAKLKKIFDELGVAEKYENRFRCTRHLCYELCGNYKSCELMYTSVEDKPDYESKVIDCVIDLIKQIELKKEGSPRFECRPWTDNDHKKRRIGSLKPDSKCFERSIRLDLKPLKYYIIDAEKWREIEEHRYDKRRTRNEFEAFPADLLPTRILDEDFIGVTELSAPLNAPDILECFLRLTDMKFEIAYDLTIQCPICRKTHELHRLPIKAMFRSRKDPVFCQEAGFASLLWYKLWECYPNKMCSMFKGIDRMRFSDNTVIKRELKVKKLTESIYGECSYDYAVYLGNLNPSKDRILVFDLTTALWKKSGFHEESRSPSDYLKIWKETLCRVPNRLQNVIATWYIVCNDTEERFFENETPGGVKCMDELVEKVTEDFPNSAVILKSASDANSLLNYKLLVVPVFNTTPAKGEARHELRKLWKVAIGESKGIDLLINRVLHYLLIG